MFKVYLAGPFFNPKAKAVLGGLLTALESAGHEVWAPMRDGICCPKDADGETRTEVFDLDIGQLGWCDVVVALLDYPLAEGFRLRLEEQQPALDSYVLMPVSFPDVGTVFEIGYAHALDKYTIGYTEKKKGFNLMLSEACYGIVHSAFELTEILNALDKGCEVLRFRSNAPLEEL